MELRRPLHVLVHEYVSLDMERVVEALDELTPIERFAEAVASLERER